MRNENQDVNAKLDILIEKVNALQKDVEVLKKDAEKLDDKIDKEVAKLDKKIDNVSSEFKSEISSARWQIIAILAGQVIGVGAIVWVIVSALK